MPTLVELSNFGQPVKPSNKNRSVKRARFQVNQPTDQSAPTYHLINNPLLAAAYSLEPLEQDLSTPLITHPTSPSSSQHIVQPSNQRNNQSNQCIQQLDPMNDVLTQYYQPPIRHLPDESADESVDHSCFPLVDQPSISQTITQTTTHTVQTTIETHLTDGGSPVVHSNDHIITQSSNQSMNQTITQTVIQPVGYIPTWISRLVPVQLSVNQSLTAAISQTVGQFMRQSPVDHSNDEPVTHLHIEVPQVSSSSLTSDLRHIQPLDRSINESYFSSVYNTVVPTINQTINQSISLSVNGLQSVTNTVRRTFFVESKSDSDMPTTADLEAIKQMLISDSINQSIYQSHHDELSERHPDSELKIETQYEFIDQSEIESINESIQHTIDLASVDWWKFLNPLTEYGESTNDSVNDSDEDSDGYVIVTHSEAQESVSAFISAIISNHPQAAKMTANELRQLIDQALQPAQAQNRLVSYGYYAYYAWSWSSTASRMYSRMWMVRVAAQGAARAAGWMIFLI